MLSLLALGMLATFMLLVLSGRVSTLIALILTPIAFSVLGGFADEMGTQMLTGVEQLAPTGVMLCFAILYFSLMADVGLFDPLIRFILKVVGHDPVRIVTGTAVLALFVSLDGDGSTTYIICCSAMMPVYRRMGLNPLILACLLALACGITNMVPWGGPAATVASALNLDVAEIFVPLIPGMLAAAAFVILLGYRFGLQERRRLASLSISGVDERVPSDLSPWSDAAVTHSPTRRPKLFPVNVFLTLALLASLVAGVLPLSVLFMIATALALLINYPSLEDQKERLQAHAPSILKVISVIFAAGIFVGILNGTGMATALAQDLVELVPARLGPQLAPLTGLLSIPLGFVLANKGFFFGIVPILSEAAGHYGISPTEIARATLVGQAVHILSPIVPSTHLLVALAQVEFGSLIRFALKWAVLLSLILLGVSVLTGAIPAPGFQEHLHAAP